jgi:hypothetical protein
MQNSRQSLNMVGVATAVLAFASIALAAPFTGPTSALYLDNYGTHSIYVVQGATVINSFAYAYGALAGGNGNYQEGMIAVTDTVRTNAFPQDNGPGGIGGQYSLNGVATGVQYAEPTAPTSPDVAYDGTSDGTYNYYLQFQGSDGTQGVVRTDLDWQNPEVLFATGTSPGDYLGITYDATNQSLWISGWGQNSIQDYSMSGTLLSSFATANNNLSALAMDSADHTLWASVGQSNNLIQFDTSGNVLQQGAPSLLPGGTYLSGEFAESGGAVPEPSTLLLCGTALIGLARRLRKK